MLEKQGRIKADIRRKSEIAVWIAIFCLALSAIHASAQTTGSSSLSGVVTDPSGAVVPGATVEITNPVSEYTRTTKTDSQGNFSFPNVPINPYHVTVNLAGFAPYVQGRRRPFRRSDESESHASDLGNR